MPKLLTLVAATVVLTASNAAPKPPPGDGGVHTKLKISSLESQIVFTAQMNPKEVAIEKRAPWVESKGSWNDKPSLGYTGGEGRTMSFELIFDTYEDRTNAQTLYVDKLTSLAMQTDGDAFVKRPPKVKVEWGKGGLKFEGVIDSVDCKYTMFLPDGMPVKASCTVKLTEADALSVKK
jgi:contractile injection system tube protein